MSQVDYDIVKRIARARLAVCMVLQLVMFSAADAAETSVVPIGERSREEIVSFFTENEFGRRPADAERPLLDLRFERTDDDAPLLGGTVMRRRSRVVYAGPYATNSFPVTVFIPTDVKEPAPAFLLVCQRREGFDDCLGDADDYFPVGEIVRRGFAAAVFRTWDVAPDFNTGNTHGVFTAFERPGPYRDNRLWGTLSAWAWGASRALDLIETMPDVDASKVAVVGHSRGGKAALWAAVTDTRFAMACVNGSGCAGAKLNHIDLPKSEHIAQIARTFPYWFCSDYILWANREKEMPFDQHELLSCIAPRLLAVGSGSKDVWAGPDGERMATELARAAWADASRVSYHCHDGGHDLGLVDWDAYLSHAEKFWKRTDEIAKWLPAEPKADGARIGDRAAWGRLAAMPKRAIVVCDQLKQTIDIYDASGSNVWRWTASDDPGIAKSHRSAFANNVAECKSFDGGRKIGMVSCGGRWAIIDRATCRIEAWGVNGGWGHSIERVGKNVVAVVSTGGKGGNSLFLFDISGDAAMNPSRQKKSVLKFDSPHGLHWDGKKLWVVDTPGLHRCAVKRGKDGEPVAEVERSWLFASLGVIHGHDLRPVPGSSLLALTTHEKVLFFDLKKERWREELFIERADVKAFDPAPDGRNFLVTTAKTKWWTDSLELCVVDRKGGGATFRPCRVIPGARIYKARWAE